MHVDDHVQSSLVTPVDGFLHGSHPYRIDVAGVRVLPILPRDGNADGVETRFLDEEGAVAGERLVEPQSLLVFGRPHSPGGDCLVAFVVQRNRVEGVAQIPAKSEAAHKLKCRGHSYSSLVLLTLSSGARPWWVFHPTRVIWIRLCCLLQRHRFAGNIEVDVERLAVLERDREGHVAVGH